jgi:predicted transcriptional regulator YheO
MQISYEFIERFIENIAALFGDRCEIVIHDFTHGLDKTIVKIVNGHVSGRSVGGCPSSLFFDMYKEINVKRQDLPIHFNTEQGHILKSSTTLIRGPKGKVIGAICINFDMTDLLQSQKALQGFVDYDPERQRKEEKSELHVHDVHELMEYYLRTVEAEIGKSGPDMNKEEKLRALTFLDQKGVLQISKANVKLCDFFKISKFTLYNYLDQIRGTQGQGQEEAE